MEDPKKNFLLISPLLSGFCFVLFCFNVECPFTLIHMLNSSCYIVCLIVSAYFHWHEKAWECEGSFWIWGVWSTSFEKILRRRSECWKNWANTSISWNGGIYSLWLMAGLYQNIQVSEAGKCMVYNLRYFGFIFFYIFNFFWF